MTKRSPFYLASVAAALTAAAPPAVSQAPAPLPDADPAIWVIKDPDTTVYLFGTFHALDGKSDWFNDEVKTAFDAAGEVVLELPPMDDKSALQPIVLKYALDPAGKPLSERLSPASRAKYVKALGELGAPPTAFDKFKPFFAAITLVAAGAQKMGLTAENGAEAVITKAAKSGNKPLSGLETVDYQMGLFAGMSDAAQMKMLEETLDQMDEFGPLFTRMNEYWTKGDSEGFAKLMNEMNAQSPEAYKRLLTDRNANWAQWVDDRLDRPGTAFVAVGAGHLAGGDSVQKMLAKRGIASERLASK